MATNFGKLNFAVAFNPQTAFPLDARCYFESKALADNAASKAEEAGSTTSVYYYGQTFVVNEGGVATLYIVQPNKTLKEVGSVPVGDGKSIEVVDGKIQLKGFGNGYYKYNADVEGHYEFVEGSFIAGLQPQIIASTEGTGFEIAWFEPNPTTVEGLETQISSLSGSVNTLSGKVDTNTTNISGLDTRVGEVESKVSTLEGAGYATQTWVEEKGYLTSHQDISGKADKDSVYTKEEIDGKGYLTSHQDISGKVDRTELSNYYTKEQANSEFMTQAEVDARVNQVITDAVEGDTLTSLTELVEYINTHGGEATELATAVENLETNKANKSEVYTKTESDGLLANKADKSELFSGSYNDLSDKPEIPSVAGLASEQFVNDAIAGVETQIPTDYLVESDLDGYATEAFVSSEIVKAVTEGKVDLTGYATEQWVEEKGYLTAHQDISGKVDRTELSSYYTKTEIDGKGFLTEHQDISGKADISYVDEKFAQAPTSTDIDSKVNAAKEELNGTITELQGDVTTNSNEIGAIKTSLGEKASQSDLDGVSSRVTVNENNISGLTTRVGAVETTVGGHTTKISSLETTVANNKTSVDASINTHSELLDGLRTDVDNNASEIDDIKTSLIPNAISESKSYADGIVVTAKSEAISSATSQSSQELADTIKNYSTTTQMNEAIASAVNNASHIKKEIVEELPSSPVEDIIYMIDQDGNGVYEEWTLINGELKKIGDTSVDLTGYAKENWVTTQISNAQSSIEDGILVKSIDENQLKVDENGKLSIKQVSTDLLVQGEIELILSGGAA